jgi:hypothetical protein
MRSIRNATASLRPFLSSPSEKLPFPFPITTLYSACLFTANAEPDRNAAPHMLKLVCIRKQEKEIMKRNRAVRVMNVSREPGSRHSKMRYLFFYKE